MEDKIQLKRTQPNFSPGPRVPHKTYYDDVGIDLEYFGPKKILWPFSMLDLPTGWDIKVPDGCWGEIKSRSSTFFRRRMIVLEGVIDPTYAGPLSVAVFNPTPWPKIIKPKERFGQLIIHKVQHRDLYVVKRLPKTIRGDRGFGSTGR